MFPLTTPFIAELLFWLLAGYFACARIALLSFEGSYRDYYFVAVGNASLHGIWVVLATGRVELGIAELTSYLMTVSEWADLNWHQRVAVHIGRQFLWFAAVVWWWPR